MARMIPPYFGADAPPGERAIFDVLAQDPSTDGWSVLHSLHIADHVNQVEGEADFVIIAPGLGVLVVEVKSHEVVAVQADGTWKLGTQLPTSRGPVKQAANAMYSLREFLKKRNVDLFGVPILSAAWFTHTRVKASLPKSPEWHEWQILDSVDLERGVADSVRKTFKAGRHHLGEKTAIFRGQQDGPDIAKTDQIARILRPIFEVGITDGDKRNAREKELLHFIDEQFEALDGMSDNQRVLFTGSAGTGKTLLAREAALRELHLGKKGALICFNALLGQQLRDSFSDEAGITVSTFHALLLKISGIKKPPANANGEFWSSELIKAATERLLESEDVERFQFLIVDEMQDLTNEEYLDILDLLVEGGMAGGRVLMFGDFEHQTIYEPSESRLLLEKRIPGLAKYELKTNCRNLPRIAHAVETFNVHKGYRSCRRRDDGVAPTIIRITQESERSDQLREAISELRDEGFALNDITVLSPMKRGSAAESTQDPWLRQVLSPAGGSKRSAGVVGYATIHAYKGLESSAVILTDLNAKSVPTFDALLYVGITRATDRLVLMFETETLTSQLKGSK